ncbi:hypothetical protein [Butyrivibrio sp. WCD2001]|uniref:hypothetical protein n=1 Tax=Butyrivibrio sp. WCD2001 TaxID=1280681 RepID=UPI0003FB3E78|nr:hypothetical protein [Butyrivibrio sp. WCD2001]
MGLEIERKFTVKKLPENLEKYPVHIIEQGYLSVVPAIRVRREDDRYYMTYKSYKGFGISGQNDSESGAGDNAGVQKDIGKIEYNLPLDKDSYDHLVEKADGNVIRKKRYIIPVNEDAFEDGFLRRNSETREAFESGDIKIELDVFGAPFDGRILAEVEFPSEEAAAAYCMADWFDEDVTGDVRFSNAHMSTEKVRDCSEMV